MTRKTLASLEAEIDKLKAENRYLQEQLVEEHRRFEVARSWMDDKKDLSNRLLNVIEGCAREGNMKI